MLAALAVQPGRPVSTAELSRWLWQDDALPLRPDAAIQTYVCRLRHSLGGNASVLTLPSAYMLTIDRHAVDALAFEDLVRKSAETADMHASSALLDHALHLWNGPPLATLPTTEAVAAERTRLNELGLTATERRNDLSIKAGRTALLIGPLTQLVRQFPLRERFVAQLMACLAREARRAEALALYRDMYRRYRDEFGIEPIAELQDLHRSLLG